MPSVLKSKKFDSKKKKKTTSYNPKFGNKV